MAHLVYLVGPPAVGKLTVARELARRTGAVVVDNHLVNDPVFVPLGLGRDGDVDATDALRARVLDVVLEATELAPPQLSHVFTNWLSDAPKSVAVLQRLRTTAARRGVPFVPVWLDASTDALAERVVHDGRSQRAKLRDPDTLHRVLAVPRLPPPADALVLDTTHLQPHEVAERVLQRMA